MLNYLYIAQKVLSGIFIRALQITIFKEKHCICLIVLSGQTNLAGYPFMDVFIFRKFTIINFKFTN